MSLEKYDRKLPIGAELQKKGVHFRVWSPDRKNIKLILNGNSSFEMESEKNDYFSLFIEEAKEGDLYQFQLDNEDKLLPDPAGRYQPQGPQGPTQIYDSEKFKWTDQNWKGDVQQRIIYEMHIGTFTKEGTWKSAEEKLKELKEMGINTIEMMPVNEFAGKFGWGYDGINLFAPTHLYGTPDDLKSFINAAHELQMSAILDVVFNHFGPENIVEPFSKYYFSDKHKTDWGTAINFESKEVREFFLSNACYWIKEFHFDGLRIDATQSIFDDSEPHILAEITDNARKSAEDKKIFIVGECESQIVNYAIPTNKGGCGLDALWNDDFHHTSRVRLTSKREAYYTDYKGEPQEFISAIKHGFLFQGQWYKWQKQRRGTLNLELPPFSFVHFLQNHDQIANTWHGKRLHQISNPSDYRTMTAMLMLGPQIPMLFQGQEFGVSTPFFYFSDQPGDLLPKMVREGRKEFLAQFPSAKNDDINFINPDDPETFNASKINHLEKNKNKEQYLLHKDLINIRQKDKVMKNLTSCQLEGAVINNDAFLLRYTNDKKQMRLIIFNFGRDYPWSPCPEPLIAAPRNKDWQIMWSSEDAKYGGLGVQKFKTNDEMIIQGHCCTVLKVD